MLRYVLERMRHLIALIGLAGVRNQFQRWHQFKQQTIHRSPQPDDCAGLRAIIC